MFLVQPTRGSTQGTGVNHISFSFPDLTAKMKEHIPAAEHHQVLALVAPRPFLVLGGGSADGPASWPFVKAALPVYELYGAKDRVGLFDHKGKHSFPREGRRIAYRWLDHWLGHTPRQEEADK